MDMHAIAAVSDKYQEFDTLPHTLALRHGHDHQLQSTAMSIGKTKKYHGKLEALATLLILGRQGATLTFSSTTEPYSLCIGGIVSKEEIFGHVPNMFVNGLGADAKAAKDGRLVVAKASTPPTGCNHIFRYPWVSP
jgi:hypothetical protein|mmetsp:Transcript_40093/g.65076  ORF Transcript_40093/g.65076 Transcript_40093/m.65076 type:complete len:136 (+) Transcript_40093:1289-1696(+)